MAELCLDVPDLPLPGCGTVTTVLVAVTVVAVPEEMVV